MVTTMSSRDSWGGRWLSDFFQDLCVGMRVLRRNPGFSLLAVLCLTLGIGANAAVFSWIEGVLLRPYPLVANQERMAAIVGTVRGGDRDDMSWPDFQDLERQSTLAESFIAEKISGATLSIGDRAEKVLGSVVSANYFSALGLHMALGRGFEPGENTGRNAHPVVVISYQFWQERYHGDPAIIGKTQMLNNVPHTIIGVAPEGFYGTFVGYGWQFWVPISMQPAFDYGGVYKLEDRGARWIEGFVVARPGVSRVQLQQELSAIAARLEAEYPGTDRGRGVQLYPLWETPFNNAGALGPTLVIALCIVMFVLLIACANVGNLLLVRAFHRRHEMTLRLALGAGRARLLRQVMTEGLILSALAAVGGLVLAWWCRNLLVYLLPPRGTAFRFAGQLDWRVFALTAAVCIAATVLFALVPALQSSQTEITEALRSESTGVVGGRRKTWFRSSLVIVQVSLSFLLLVGAGLVLRSLARLRSASPGFSTDRVVATSFTFAPQGYDAARARNFEDELLARVHALPGVESASWSRSVPFTFLAYSSAPIAVDGYEPPRNEQPTANFNEVSPGYFSTMGIPLDSGRAFTRSDDENSQLVAIVNEVMVEKYWRGANPVGRRLQANGKWLEVVGVARLSKYFNFMETPQAFFYVPLRQNFSMLATLEVRTATPPQAITALLGREIRALDQNMPVYEAIPMREVVNRSMAAPQVAVTLLTVFGSLALVLSAIGLYAVMSYAVSQGTRELGLRMALGARAPDLLRMVVGRGLALTVGGVAIGAVAAFGLTRLLGYLLYQVSPRDPAAFAASFAVMLAVALAATLVPAWRATRINPLRALQG
ncbi:MAG TPA: ABC transporter permease [Candidatus Acidoferrales bacterium]|nr:ABC transporter permease [Candidatus Acidoferrales bacterium]